jgi:hypothetical protein
MEFSQYPLEGWLASIVQGTTAFVGVGIFGSGLGIVQEKRLVLAMEIEAPLRTTGRDGRNTPAYTASVTRGS